MLQFTTSIIHSIDNIREVCESLATGLSSDQLVPSNFLAGFESLCLAKLGFNNINHIKFYLTNFIETEIRSSSPFQNDFLKIATNL